MIPRTKSLYDLLTPRRLSYAWMAGSILWVSWLISIAFGPRYHDLADQVIGTDYLQYYTAGYLVRTNESAQLYNMNYLFQLERTIIGPELKSYYGFITPPFLAWLFVPFSMLNYPVSFALWSILSLLALWMAIYLLNAEDRTRTFLWSLTWFPIFATISFGQNSLLSLLLVALSYRLWQKGYLFSAGLVISLLSYKPQLLLGVTLLWLLDWSEQRKTLAGLALGSGFLALLCFGLLPEASQAYWVFVRTVLPDLPNWEHFPLHHLHTVRGFWRLLLPSFPLLADGITLIFSSLGIAVFLRFRQQFRNRPELCFAGSICLTMWITPHAMIYDWTLLLIPAILLWNARPDLSNHWKLLFALIWIVSFISGSLAFVQRQILPVAFQVSVPVLALVLYFAYRWLMLDARYSMPDT